jgi:choline transport protein
MSDNTTSGVSKSHYVIGGGSISSKDEMLAEMGLRSVVSAAELKGELDYITSDLDAQVLGAVGYDATIPRNYSALNGLGLGFSITNSWVGYIASFSMGLVYGGPQVTIFSLFVAFFLQCTISSGLAEIASAFPVSGGQYNYVQLLAPEETKKFASFITGWLSLVGWLVVTCSGISLSVFAVLGVIIHWNPEVDETKWLIYCIFIAILAISSIPVFFFPRYLPLIGNIALYLSFAGCFTIFVVALVTKQHTNPSSFILSSEFNTSGWSKGVAWCIGITNAMYAYGGSDAAIHISEEIPNPGRIIPGIIITTLVLGFVTVVPFITALLYGMVDMDAVANAASPAFELFRQVTGSSRTATFCTLWFVVQNFGSLCSQYVTCGRLAYAIARDNAIPYSNFWTVIDKKSEIPLRTTIASMVFCALYGLLYFASSTAFNSIVSSAVLGLNITYTIPQAILVIHGREKLPKRAFNLGNLGYFCNIMAPIILIFDGVFVCLPFTIPTTAQSMNYASVVIVGLFMIVIAMWFIIGKKYEGPEVSMENISKMNEKAMKLDAELHEGKELRLGLFWY